MINCDSFNKLLSNCDPLKRYIIAVQGCSASGKTTLTTHIAKELSKKNIPTVLISLDRYYKAYTGSKEELINYDFDNPAALDWDAIRETLESYNTDSDFAIEYEFSYLTKKSKRNVITNIHPKIIIIEGIFSFNLFNDMVYNVSAYDPFNSKKMVKNEYVKNNFELPNFNILKVLLVLEKESMYKIRLQRDIETGNASLEESTFRFNNQIWPSTTRWVYSKNVKGDLVINGGTFNLDESDNVVRSILSHFRCFDEECSFKKKMINRLLKAKL